MSGERAAPAPIRAVISDFGGVLTTPLLDGFLAVERASGVPVAAFAAALAAVAARDGVNPLYELECARISEREFLAAVGAELGSQLGREVSMSEFAATWFGGLRVNEQLLERLRPLRSAGYRLAICTNNVREWEPIWRAMLPVQETFDVVVDSSAIGIRKPDREIYELTLERLEVTAPEAVFIDDVPANCEAARELGMRAIHFQTNDQTLAELEELLRS